ncbi:rubrerythrin family protein [Prosthecochloris sp. GSB1]|uniref:rubrerythrin family protein n=1 Tax=Prosthecochloris sp. GSB1 TaxID=281093 RepID=UPI000B8D0F96|nr:rubrerythrin family protein [Prosthecochloris sp. GSB1]ASQ90998.1 rubrerythrin family protein [Prosthecochloris sp. GSB1]
MDQHLSEHLDESISLELNIARLYTLFHDLFPDDEDFWWQLAIEERNHAALLRNEKKASHSAAGAVPENLLAKDLESLKIANAGVAALVERYRTTSPGREEAFRTAYTLENSIGEVHFQEFMDRKSCSLSDELFRQLNQEDKDHAERIRHYMQEHGITAEAYI